MRLKNSPWWRNNPINLQQFRRQIKEKLVQGGLETPGNTSLVLLAHALQRSKSWILSHNEYKPTPQEALTLQTSVTRLLEGFPLPYLLGYWDFFSRRFMLTPDVLIPRPETELLVELSLQLARQFDTPRIMDVGTGSGVIAVTLAAELPDAQVWAADLSFPALRLAQQNARLLGQPGVHFVLSDLLMPLAGPIDLICANLPYIPRKVLAGLDVSRWEPALALDGGESGLDLIARLLEQAQTRLSAQGAILLETDSSLGAETLTLAQAAFPHAQHRLVQDLAGYDRIVEIRLS